MSISQTRPLRLHRLGLTLVEILVALTMTLIVLGAMMTAFSYASQEMQLGRAVMGMANRLRAAEELMRSDLKNLTVDPRPYTESTNPNGYFEYVEGPRLDTATGPGYNYLGDLDDIWCGTIRSESRPFRGRYIRPPAGDTIGTPNYPTVSNPQAIQPDVLESTLAEVVWWSDYVEADGNYRVDLTESVTIYRRLLLIVPDSVLLPTFTNFGAAVSYLATNDISARIVTTVNGGTTYYRLIANTLKDLAHRQVRFCHNPVLGAGVGTAPAPVAYPHPLHRNSLWLVRSSDYKAGGSLDLAGGGTYAYEPNGADIVLTDVAAFDVKVYSPQAAVLDMNNHPTYPANTLCEPGDPGYETALAALPLPRPDPDPVIKTLGAFVNLGHVGGDWFAGSPTAKSFLEYQFMFDYRFPRDTPGAPSVPPAWVFPGSVDRVYDTWTPLYESDGVDQDGSGIVDQGTNGLDNGGTQAPDDDFERETAPPYPFPVRGVNVSIRLIEKSTKQIYQSSVTHSYVPE